MFFCKYNDPIYVKLEKLDIMIALASERNIDQVLLELKEYATEVDVDFVRKVSLYSWNAVPCRVMCGQSSMPTACLWNFRQSLHAFTTMHGGPGEGCRALHHYTARPHQAR